MDHEIHGGEQWWREIIRTIQQADVFVFALSQDSWTSQPCREELDYAQRLGLPILPVQVGSLQSVRIPIMETQGIDYRERTANAALALVAALTELTSRPVERTDPPPEPPKVPFEYLYRIAEILGPTPIAPDHQEAVISQLRRKLREERDAVARADIVKLLREFRRRKELTVGNSEEIDQLLDGVEGTTASENEDGATRLPPSDHWRQSQAADGERARAKKAEATTPAAAEPVTPPPPTPAAAEHATSSPPKPPTPPLRPRKPPQSPPSTPKVESTPKREPGFEWHRPPEASKEAAAAPPKEAPAAPQEAPTPPAGLGRTISTDGGTPTVHPSPTAEPPTSGWWKAVETKKVKPAKAEPTANDGGLAFVGAILGVTGIPLGIAALTPKPVALLLLLVVSVLGLSIGLVAVSRGERRSRVAVAIAVVGLLGAILFALTTGHF